MEVIRTSPLSRGKLYTRSCRLTTRSLVRKTLSHDRIHDDRSVVDVALRIFDLEQVQLTHKEVVEYANVRHVSILVQILPQMKMRSRTCETWLRWRTTT